MAAVGCPRNCAEATVKDIGLIGIEGGWQVVVGGAAGKSVRKADLLDDRRDHRAGARGLGAVLPVLPRERQLPRAHVRLRRAARHREGAQGDGLRTRAGARRPARSLSQVKGACTRCVAGRSGAATSHAVRDRRGAGMRWIRVTRCDNIPPREGRAVSLAGREIAIFNLVPRRGRPFDRARGRGRRSVPRRRQSVPAQGRSAGRWHRHRYVGGVSAAHLEN